MTKKRRYQSEWNRGEGSGIWLPVIVVVALMAAVIYFFWPYGQPPSTPVTEQPPPASQLQEPEQPDAEPEEPRYPVPESSSQAEETTPPAETPASDEPQQAAADQADAEPDPEAEPDSDSEAEPESSPEMAEESLPSLDNSDAPLRQSVEREVAANRFEELFIPESMIRHFVVTIDNMTRQKLPEKYDFTRPVSGSFKVRELEDDSDTDEARYQLDPANYDRYKRYIVFAESVDLDRLVAIYQRYYPLFQEAYEELGFPDRYFNDRFVEVIDHLLDTPRVEPPIELVRPKVFYEFADPQLEALSAGRKLLIRVGPDNAARIKNRLQALRDRLTSLQPQL